MQHRRSADPRGAVLFQTLLPLQLAGLGIQPIERRPQIDDERRQTTVTGRLADHDRRAHPCVRLERPRRTAVLQSDRVDAAGRAADEDAIADDRGIGGCGRFPFEAKRPAQLEQGRLLGAQAGLALISLVRQGHAPAAPVALGDTRRVGSFAACRHGCNGRARHGQIGGNQAFLRRGQRLPLHAHQAGFERRDDPLLRQRRQQIARRRPRAAVMALGAMLRVERRAVLRPRRSRHGHQHQPGDDATHATFAGQRTAVSRAGDCDGVSSATVRPPRERNRVMAMPMNADAR